MWWNSQRSVPTIWLDVGRPSPARLEHFPTKRERAGLDEIEVAVVKRDQFVGILEALDDDPRHPRQSHGAAQLASRSYRPKECS